MEDINLVRARQWVEKGPRCGDHPKSEYPQSFLCYDCAASALLAAVRVKGQEADPVRWAWQQWEALGDQRGYHTAEEERAVSREVWPEVPL